MFARCDTLNSLEVFFQREKYDVWRECVTKDRNECVSRFMREHLEAWLRYCVTKKEKTEFKAGIAHHNSHCNGGCCIEYMMESCKAPVRCRVTRDRYGGRRSRGAIGR